MEPAEVLELMRSAPQRYDTVRAALRYRGHGPTIKALQEQYLASEAGRLETGDSPASSEEGHRLEPNGPFRWGCRVWYAALAPVVAATASS